MYGALLTDLSRAFDCLPTKLLVTKLNAYGVDSKSCMMIANYFCGRKQRVKLAHTVGNWMDVIKGAPQGSLMGPFTYNIHSNDLLYAIMKMCYVYNYADDNTIGCSGKYPQEVQMKLENVSNVMLKWFDENMMKANPEKFQYIIFNRNKKDGVNVINVNNVVIESSPVVKLLGVHVDYNLSFNYHIHEICRKAGLKLNVLARVSRILDSDSSTKMLLFNSCIISQFNFCPIVWHYCCRGDMLKMERMQYRALKYVFCDYNASYTELRQRSKKKLLYENRLNYILYEVLKCVRKLNPSYLHKMFSIKSNVYNIRGKQKLQQPVYNIVKCGKNRFSYHGANYGIFYQIYSGRKKCMLILKICLKGGKV